MYTNKFKTCARTRLLENQVLGVDFYIKEASKPLFNNASILTIHNLYFHHIAFETFKILKHRAPIALYSNFKFPKFNGQTFPTLLLELTPSKNFFYMATCIWNLIRTKIPNLSYDFAIKFSCFKTHLKNMVHQKQIIGDKFEWSDDNFCKYKE